MRFRQCISEARVAKSSEIRRASMFNALKYFTSLPVIASGHFLGEWSIAAGQETYEPKHWENHAFVFWLW
jgi:hypothetical protein